MIYGSLFSGIGGLDLACERAGMTCAWQVEIDPFCRSVLAKHWPSTPRYDDVRAVHGAALLSVDVVVGGFPCQDVSVAGKRRGIEAGERSGLWFEFYRLLTEIRPRGVLVENVGGLAGGALDIVASGLHGLGYAVEVSRIAASDVGAPHRRIRHFLVGVADSNRDPVRQQRGPQDGREAAPEPAGAGGVADAAGERREGWGRTGAQSGPQPEPVRRRDAGAGVEGGTPRHEPHRRDPTVADADGARLEELEPRGDRNEHAPTVGVLRGQAQPGLGRGAHGVPDGLDGPGPGGAWPAARGEPQESWEAPRALTGPRANNNRPARLRALGNAVVPQQGYVAALRLRQLIEGVR